jgi:hypothetical protein
LEASIAALRPASPEPIMTVSNWWIIIIIISKTKILVNNPTSQDKPF